MTKELFIEFETKESFDKTVEAKKTEVLPKAAQIIAMAKPSDLLVLSIEVGSPGKIIDAQIMNEETEDVFRDVIVNEMLKQ